MRLIVLAIAAVSGITSCRHSQCRDCSRDDRPPLLPRGGGLSDPIPPGVIQPRDSAIPPLRVPTTPSRGFESLPDPDLSIPRRETFRPATPGPLLQQPVLPVVPDSPPNMLPPATSSYRPPPERMRSESPPLLPVPDRLVLNEPVMPATRSDLPDESELPPRSMDTPPPSVSRKELLYPDDLPSGESKPPPLLKAPASTSALPEFARALGTSNDVVSVGRKPHVDGFTWLKSNGYRTVLFLHAPDADLSAIRLLVEKQGMTFVPLAVTATIVPTAFDALRKQLAEKTNRPLFVCDDDGASVGSLFYLYFRVVEVLNDDQARIRSGPLGLKDPSSSVEQKKFWLAIQDYLSKR